MSVQVKGSGTIGGLDEGLAVSGIITSSTQLNVGSNIKIGSAGVVTATSFSGSGANLTSIPAANITGTLPAISGANLTSLPAQATIANNADNRIITGGSGVNLNGEANLTFDSSNRFTIGSANPMAATDYGTAKINGSAGGVVAFSVGDTQKWEVYGNAAQLQIYDRANTKYNTKFKAGGNVEITDGNLVLASGHGIDFSSTGQGGSSSSMQNELLADYEEGTWVPVAHNFTISSTYHANYTRIGRTVHITMWVQTASGSSGSPFYIAGLPYTVKTGNVYQYACGRLGSGGHTNSASDIVFEFTTGNTTIFPKVQDGGMNWGMASGTHVMLTGTYIT